MCDHLINVKMKGWDMMQHQETERVAASHVTHVAY